MTWAWTFLLVLARARAEPLPVPALYKAALAHAPQLAEASAAARRADFERLRATAGFLPRVDAYAEHDAWASASQPTPQVRIRPANQDSWELRAEETVFSGGQVLNGCRETSAAARAARLSESARRQALLREVGVLSLRWLEAAETLKQADAELSRRRGHLEAAKKRQAAGVLPEAEELRAEAEVQKAASEQLEAERAQLELRSRLETMTGLELSSGLSPAPPLPLPEGARDAFADEASRSNPAARAEEQNLLAAEFGARARRGRFLPSLSVGGAYRGMRQTPETLEFLSHETLGFVQARWNLFSGGERWASARSAEASAAAARERARQARDEQSLKARLAFDAAKTADAAIAAEQSRRDSASASYERVRKRFEAGVDPYLNLLDAATALKTAESALIAARYSRERAVLDLHWALGSIEGAVLK